MVKINFSQTFHEKHCIPCRCSMGRSFACYSSLGRGTGRDISNAQVAIQVRYRGAWVTMQARFEGMRVAIQVRFEGARVAMQARYEDTQDALQARYEPAVSCNQLLRSWRFYIRNGTCRFYYGI